MSAASYRPGSAELDELGFGVVMQPIPLELHDPGWTRQAMVRERVESIVRLYHVTRTDGAPTDRMTRHERRYFNRMHAAAIRLSVAWQLAGETAVDIDQIRADLNAAGHVARVDFEGSEWFGSAPRMIAWHALHTRRFRGARRAKTVFSTGVFEAREVARVLGIKVDSGCFAILTEARKLLET